MNKKILDKEVRDYLIEAGVDKKEVRKMYRDCVHALVVERLEEITQLMKDKKYKKVDKYLEFSPAGDDMGSDNYFISFNDIIDGGRDYSDLGDMLSILGED